MISNNIRLKSTIIVFFMILFGLVFGCAKKNVFVKLVTSETDTGLLYLIRPEHASLALWDYDCILSRYPGKFSSSVKPTPIYTIELENGSLGYLRLQEGTYQLDVVGKPDATKVFQIKKGEEKYIEFKIFSETKFSRSEITFREINKEYSLEEILSVPLFTERSFVSVQMPIE
ncbi:hypothetical protein EHQ68_07340 [Leptospira congkakensis]|uniref:DUF2846 domain-containing protein n=1 Tax=Leptospira congkakensis TaxID=2484932 RepID=A0A4Z1A193_9LEPT|nr:hypothetical protein [Leptospira congkakensis]TGL87580.1 hypothetical protein EHQ69_15820 [Leptospira congkakensis]TGL89805.1 hypothetical protein EHQ68_07340 [Leptospira congkakensis]TGL95730.1 hypothetical protein EHQ70_11490 [Leptospira congkakensis]